jgi:uncharacterized membrane protein
MIEILPNWHPMFVHFTVALLFIAVLLSVLTKFMSAGTLREQCQLVAQWNLWLGAGFTILTVVAGVAAYNSVAHDTPSHEAMTLHRNWALVTAALFIILAVWSWRRAKAGQGMNTMLLIALLVGAGLLASTAWLGGEAVYRYGLGVMSLPKTDSHEHTAEGHGGAHGGDSHEQADAHHDRPVHDNSDGHHDVKKVDDHHDKPVHDNSDGHHDKEKVEKHHDDGHAH